MEWSLEEIGHKGKFILAKAIRIGNSTVISKGRFIKCAFLKDEDYEDIGDPNKIVRTLRRCRQRPDLFTFIQRYPNTAPIFDFYKEDESIAVLKIRTYEEWVKQQISPNAKRLIDKAKKNGVEARISQFDGSFIDGMVEIFNESPIRQNRPFWHYGKDHATIEREFSKYLYREEILGAYWKGKLIGFIFISYAGNYVIPTQIISKLAHRDKGVMNFLLAKLVELCEEKKIRAIAYGDWQESSLTEFKRRNGFEKVYIPRYYVPLTLKGIIAIKLGIHRGIFRLLPKHFQYSLQRIRSLTIRNLR